MRRFFTRHSLRQRLIALAAAYVIALAGLVASFAGAEAAGAFGDSTGILCHGEGTGPTAPSPGDTNTGHCVDCCSIGCMMLMAALPEPPATAAAIPRSVGEVLRPLAPAVPIGAPQTKFHRSRAPPLPV